MGAALQLEGLTFGELTVIKRVANNERNQTMWLCQCSCGKLKVVQGSYLTFGTTKSCGHLQRLAAANLKRSHRDLKGQMFGELEPLYKLDTPGGFGRSIWHCKCHRCGRETDMLESDLISKNRSSCGCVRGCPQGKAPNLTGQKFGKWTVLGLDCLDSLGAQRWKVKCECGTESSVKTGDLMSGHSTACVKCRNRASVAAVKQLKLERDAAKESATK